MDSTLDKPAQDTQAEYGAEVLCASWNPLVAAAAAPEAVCRELATESKVVDVDDFLASFYRSQQG